MLSIPPAVSIFLYTPPADLRKGFDGLAGLVREHFAADPTDGRDDRSRMSGDAHVRFWESAGVQFRAAEVLQEQLWPVAMAADREVEHVQRQRDPAIDPHPGRA